MEKEDIDSDGEEKAEESDDSSSSSSGEEEEVNGVMRKKTKQPQTAPTSKDGNMSDKGTAGGDASALEMAPESSLAPAGGEQAETKERTLVATESHDDDGVVMLQDAPAKKIKLKKIKADMELVKREPAKVWATQVAPASLRLHWQPFELNTGFTVAGYRIAQCDHVKVELPPDPGVAALRREKKYTIEQTPFKVICENTFSTECEFVVVNLKPGSGYTFKVTAYTKQGPKIPYKMIGGSLITSSILKTKEAKFVYSWFFENIMEIEKEWRIFFDDPKKDMERRKTATAVQLRTKSAAQTERLSQLMMSLTAKDSDNYGHIYYVGKACCEITFNGEYAGGIFIDAVTNDNREYEFKAMVRHSVLPDDATSLRIWDHDDDWVISTKRCVRQNQWEELRVVMTGSHKFRSRIHIQVNEGYKGTVWIDAVTVSVLGKSKLALAAHQLEVLADEMANNRPKAATLYMQRAYNLPLLGHHMPCNSFAQVSWAKPSSEVEDGPGSPGSPGSPESPGSDGSSPTSPK